MLYIYRKFQDTQDKSLYRFHFLNYVNKNTKLHKILRNYDCLIIIQYFNKFPHKECTQTWRILRWLCTHDWPSRRIRVFRSKNTDDTESERERSWRREREKPRRIHVCSRRSSVRLFRNTSLRVGSLEEASLCSRETCRECSPGFDVNTRYVYCPPIIQCGITSVSSINAFSPSVSLD